MMDISLFTADVPAGTYTVGDIIPLACKSGPAAVRSGYGAAYLKEIDSGSLSFNAPFFEIVVENSNLIDPIINGPSQLTSDVAVDELSTGVQLCNDLEVQANSTWTIYAKCVRTVTTTKADSLFCTINIDYPSVGSVSDPITEKGIPATLELDVAAVPIQALGTTAAATWTVLNVDNFKPGFKYLMSKMSALFNSTDVITGFVQISNAAGQNGLSRIIPMSAQPNTVAKRIKDAAVLTKGPMDYKFMFFAENAGTADLTLLTDFVKRAF